jgi:hypothetical protein
VLGSRANSFPTGLGSGPSHRRNTNSPFLRKPGSCACYRLHPIHSTGSWPLQSPQNCTTYLHHHSPSCQSHAPLQMRWRAHLMTHTRSEHKHSRSAHSTPQLYGCRERWHCRYLVP